MAMTAHTGCDRRSDGEAKQRDPVAPTLWTSPGLPNPHLGGVWHADQVIVGTVVCPPSSDDRASVTVEEVLEGEPTLVGQTLPLEYRCGQENRHVPAPIGGYQPVIAEGMRGVFALGGPTRTGRYGVHPVPFGRRGQGAADEEELLRSIRRVLSAARLPAADKPARIKEWLLSNDSQLIFEAIRIMDREPSLRTEDLLALVVHGFETTTNPSLRSRAGNLLAFHVGAHLDHPLYDGYVHAMVEHTGRPDPMEAVSAFRRLSQLKGHLSGHCYDLDGTTTVACYGGQVCGRSPSGPSCLADWYAEHGSQAEAYWRAWYKSGEHRRRTTRAQGDPAP
jgi:hypothetical protein